MAEIGSPLTSPEDGWQRIDQTNTNISFINTTFTTGTGTGFYGGSQTYSNVLGAKIRFSFYGTKLRIIDQKNVNRSQNIKITIDDLWEYYDGRLDGTSTGVNQVLFYERLNLDERYHLVEIELPQADGYLVLDCIDIDATGYMLPSVGSKLTTPENGWSRIDSANTSNITYTGTWLISTSTNWYGGNAHYSTVLNSSYSFTFTGTGLRLISYLYTDRDTNVKVTIDGESYYYNPYYFEARQMGINFEKRDLPLGTHTVVVTKVSNDTKTIDIDAIDIIAEYQDQTELPSEIIVPSNHSLTGQLTITPQNKMTGKVKIIGVGKSAITGSLTVSTYNDFPSNIVVYSDEVIEQIAYPPRWGNQRKAYLQVLDRANLPSTINITPKNKMAGVVEVIPPPTMYLEYTPIQDAFVRDGIKTLNYGTEQTMVVGASTSNEKYRSFVKFEIGELPENIIIKDISLNLYNTTKQLSDQRIGVYTLSDDWTEYGVTWSTQPAISNLVNIEDVGSVDGYVNFDVTEEVTNWINGTSQNNGFLIKAVNENIQTYEQFYTRESSANQPKLIIAYTQDVIFSFGRVELPSTIDVIGVRDSDLFSTIYIPELDKNRDLPSSIHVYNFNYMLEGSIDVNRFELPSTITISQATNDSLSSSISIRVKGGAEPVANVESELNVSAYQRMGIVNVLHRSQVESTIVIPFNANNQILGSMSIIQSQVNGTLRVRQRENSDINGLVSIASSRNSSITGNLSTIRDSIQAQLVVRQSETDSITGEFIVVQHQNSDLQSSLSVIRYELPCSISVVYSDRVIGTLIVQQSQVEDIQATLKVPNRKDLNANLTVIGASMIPGEMFIVSGFMKGNLVIPYRETYDFLGKMNVRVKAISDLTSTIFVGGDNIPGGFVIII